MGRILAVQETESTANLRYSLYNLNAASQMGYGLIQEGTLLGYVPSSEHSEQGGEQRWRVESDRVAQKRALALLFCPCWSECLSCD